MPTSVGRRPNASSTVRDAFGASVIPTNSPVIVSARTATVISEQSPASTRSRSAFAMMRPREAISTLSSVARTNSARSEVSSPWPGAVDTRIPPSSGRSATSPQGIAMSMDCGV